LLIYPVRKKEAWFMANVCDVLVRLLAEADVKHIFGVPGDAINSLTESIRQQNKVRFIHVNHEESGAFAAVGQAKLTGGLGVCAGTAGPGALHLLNALYDAKCDRASVLAITGQVESNLIGSDAQQEIDLHTLFKDVCVYNQIVVNPEHFPYLAVQAIQAALEQKGVAHLNIPVDIAEKAVANPDKWHLRLPDIRTAPVSDNDIERASELINQSDNIVILAGIGCYGAEGKVLALANHLQAPIIHTLRAKELFPESGPYSIGGLGNLGIKPAVYAIENCDLLIMIGTNFPYVDFLPGAAKVIQIDIDMRQLGKRIPIDAGIAGDAGAVIDRLLPYIKIKPESGFLKEAQLQMKHWKDSVAQELRKERKSIKPQQLSHMVGQASADNAIFVCDTGEVTAWVARYLPIRLGQRFTLSGMLASMAFGLPAAIGAKLAFPDRQVIAIVGDGGFSMLMTDFSTAVKYKLPIMVVVFNNRRLGMIRIEQEARGMPEYNTDLHNPDFAEFAKICGGDGLRITDPDELEPAMAQGLASDVPFVLDVIIDAEEKIIPPKVTWSQIANYGMARIKEALDKK
jgi:thiamine pyrophosphate-dependent acetolactate synthase large subunit-like protein